MAELWNYLVLENVSVEAAAALVTQALEARGWPKVQAAEPGVHSVAVFRADNGLTIVDLTGDWPEADKPLHKAISKAHDGPVVLSHHDGAGEVEAFLCLRGGKKAAAAGALGDAASERAGDLTEAPGTRIELTFRAPAEPATATVTEAINRHFKPLFGPLGLRPVKVPVRYHPSIDQVIAFGRTFETGRRVVLRFDFGREKVIDLGVSVVVTVDGADAWVGPAQARDDAQHNKWSENPAFYERDLRMLAGGMARDLRLAAEKLPELGPLVATASAGEAWRQAEADFPELLRNRKIAEVRTEGFVPATQILRGARLFTVEIEGGERFTFRLDTSVLPAGGALQVGDIVVLRSGAVFARALRVGKVVARFDELGELLGVG